MGKLVNLNVAIPVELDRQIEIHVASVRTTKKRFVTEAIQEKLRRAQEPARQEEGEELKETTDASP